MGQTYGFSALSSAPVIPGISTQTADSRPDRNSQLDIDIHSTQINNWASLVSTPLIHDNRFNVLATTDDDHSDEVVHGAAFSASQATAITVSSTETAETNLSRYTLTESDPASSSPDHDRQSRPRLAPVSQRTSRYARRRCFVWTMWVRHIPLITFVHCLEHVDFCNILFRS